MNPDKARNLGVAPVTYGEGSRPPRGDYERAHTDYTCAQAYANYTEAACCLRKECYRGLGCRWSRLSSISIVVEGCGHVGEGGGGGQRRRAAARCPRTSPVRRQAHRPYVHSPAGRAAPGFPLALAHAAHGLLMFHGSDAGFAQAAKDHLLGPR